MSRTSPPRGSTAERDTTAADRRRTQFFVWTFASRPPFGLPCPKGSSVHRPSALGGLRCRSLRRPILRDRCLRFFLRRGFTALLRTMLSAAAVRHDMLLSSKMGKKVL